MAAIDPKQMLLKHIEKVVMLLACVVLTLTVWSYPPWHPDIDQAREINKHLEEIGTRELVEYTADPELAKQNKNLELPPGIDKVPNYVGMIDELVRKPWPDKKGITELDLMKAIFVDVNMKPIGPWQVAPFPPRMLPVPPGGVLAKGAKGRVVVIFRIDQQAQRRVLEDTGVLEYTDKGLPFHSIIIKRRDVTTGETRTISKEFPEGFPKYYGPPEDMPFVPARPLGGAALDGPAHWRSTDHVVIYAQRNPPPPRDRIDPAEADQRREEERRARFEEELRRRQEELRRRQEEKTPRTGTETRRPKPRSGTKRPRPAPGRKPGPGLGNRYFWFVDNVDTEGTYEYSVTLTVKNPVHGLKKFKDAKKRPGLLTSEATTSNIVKIASFKEWYFSGGAPASEQAWCVVRVLTSEERKLDGAAVENIVREIRAGGVGVGKQLDEPAGEWATQRFEVRPGEEIGRRKIVSLPSGERRMVDFSTGVQMVALSEDYDAVEVSGSRLVQKDGALVRQEVLRRSVVPKLKITVVDRKGKTYSRWRETPPR